MINRGMVPDPRPLPKPWREGNPLTKGPYLVVDKINHTRSVAHFSPTIGWCVLGRWLGKDAVVCWSNLPEVPERIEW